MRIGLLSDTHGTLDDAIFQHFSDCDEIWHAGDFGSLAVLDRLKQWKPLRGVWGNVDGPEVRAETPQDLRWECAGVRVYMTHIGGHPGHYDKRAEGELRRAKPDLFICGHSHILRVMRDATIPLLFMNPGAAGHQGWHKIRTVLRFNVDDGRISHVEAIELGVRGRTR